MASEKEHNFKRRLGVDPANLYQQDAHYNFSTDTERKKKSCRIPSRRTGDTNRTAPLEIAKQKQSRLGSARTDNLKQTQQLKHGRQPPKSLNRPFQNNSAPAIQKSSPTRRTRQGLQNQSGAGTTFTEPSSADNPIDLSNSGDETDEGEKFRHQGGDKIKNSTRKRKVTMVAARSDVKLESARDNTPKKPRTNERTYDATGGAVTRLAAESKTTVGSAKKSGTDLASTDVIDLSGNEAREQGDTGNDASAQDGHLAPIPKKGRTKFDPDSLSIPKLKKLDTKSTARPSSRIQGNAKETRAGRGTNPLTHLPTDESKRMMEKVQEVESAPIEDTTVSVSSSRLAKPPSSMDSFKEPPSNHRSLSFPKVNNGRPISKWGQRVSSFFERGVSLGSLLNARLIGSPSFISPTAESKRIGTPIRPGQTFGCNKNTKGDNGERTAKPFARKHATRSPAHLHFPVMDSVRSNRRSPRLHGNGPQETIEILSSDDEDSSSETSVSKVDFARILLNGALKSDKNCSILFRGDSRTFELSFKVGRRIKTLTIPQDEISQCYAFEPSNHHGHVDTTYSDRLTLLLDLGITAVLLLMVDSRVFDSQKITSPRKDANKKEESVLIQFEKVEGYYDLLTSMEDAGQIVQSAGPEIEEIEGLIEAVQKVRKTRNSGTPSKKKNPFSSGKAKDDILFVYPFGEERSKIEEAAQGLEIFSAKPHGNENAEGTASSTSSNSVGFRQRSHFITIRIEDYDRLESEVWLNDSLVDFFMLWISRDIHNIHASDVHFFTSHFYSTLTKKGSEGVTTWTAKKNIDIFQKKLIFIPINKSLHWSLCVVVNPGEICRYKPGQETNKMPCLICFDSLKMHCPRQTKRKIMDWLNSEWARIRGTTGNGPFVDGSFKVFTPEVPMQDNGSDCGVFVCRYALGLYKLRHLDFSEKDVFPDGLPDRKDWRKEGYHKMITEGEGFSFNAKDIQGMRREFQKFIEKLSIIFGDWENGQKENVAAAKKADCHDGMKDVCADETNNDQKMPPTVAEETYSRIDQVPTISFQQFPDLDDENSAIRDLQTDVSNLKLRSNEKHPPPEILGDNFLQNFVSFPANDTSLEHTPPPACSRVNARETSRNESLEFGHDSPDAIISRLINSQSDLNGPQSILSEKQRSDSNLDGLPWRNTSSEKGHAEEDPETLSLGQGDNEIAGNTEDTLHQTIAC